MGKKDDLLMKHGFPRHHGNPRAGWPCGQAV